MLIADPHNQERQAIDSQLRDLLRSIPRSVVIDGLFDILSQPPQSEDLAIITDLFGLRGADDRDANEDLPQPQRAHLRSYLKSAVPFTLAQDDFRGQGKGYLSSALSKVGNPSDIADVMDLVRADITRMREGRAAWARDHRAPKAQGASMSWTSWHVEALVRLGSVESEPVLLGLLNEPEYEVDAAWALHVIAKKVQPSPNAIMGARFGQPPRDHRGIRTAAYEWRAAFAEDLRAKYASAVRRRILGVLEESKTGDHRTVACHYRLKELAKVLAALDPQDSAALILEIAELPTTRSDGWLRLALLEALVFAGIALPADRVMAILDPVLADFRAHGIYNNNASLLTRFLSLLPFLDEPKRGIARIRELLAEFRVPWYDNRNLLFALAQCSDDSGLELLCEIAGTNGIFEQVAKDWFDAVASCPLPSAHTIMLGFVDPDARACAGGRTLPDYAIDSAAGHLADLARAHPSIVERLVDLTTRPISAQQRTILGKTLAWIGSPTSLLTALNLIDDAAPQPLSYEIFRAMEDVFLEKCSYGNTQSYTLVPRAGNELKARLYEMAKHDPRRAKTAYSLLAQIEEWRLEYGRPPSEPRHPLLESGEMWPPIAPVFWHS